MELLARQDALLSGDKRYYTGNPCKYGHLSERYVCDCGCVQCQTVKQNSDSHKQYMKSYKKDYNELTKQHRYEYAKLYRLSNVEQELLRNRMFLSDNPEKSKMYRDTYYKKNKHKVLERARTRHIRKKCAVPSWYDIEKDIIKDMYKKREELSLLTGVVHHVDHIIPIAHPLVCGLHCLANLQILKAVDNIMKSNNFEVGEH